MSINQPEEVVQAFQLAWNAHDMGALGSLFADDATFVNRFGHYVRGVEAIVDLHRPIHDTIYRDSSMKNELIVAVPAGTEAAIVHFWSRLICGQAHPAGPHCVDTVIMAVVVRAGDGWLIKALENVTLTDPRTGEIVLRH